MTPRRHRGKPSRGILKAAVYGIAAGAVGAFGLHMTKPGLQPPPLPGIDRTAVLVTPEGNGYCRKVTVSNDGRSMIDARSVLCSSLTSARADLPPVLRGYQASLRTSP